MPPVPLPINYTLLDSGPAGGSTIRDIATRANVAYLTPYYPVLKKENVSAAKHVVALADHGRSFYEGDAARTFLGLPAAGTGKKCTVSPGLGGSDVKVYVQSSSHNRKIPAGAEVLLMTSVSAAGSAQTNSAPASGTTAKALAKNAAPAPTLSGSSVAASKPAPAQPCAKAAAAPSATAASDAVLPFLVDYAKSSRSKCRLTKSKIEKGELRFGVMVKSPHFDGMQPNWFSAAAFFDAKARHRQKRPMCAGEIGGFEQLRRGDIERLWGWIDGGGKGTKKVGHGGERKTREMLAEQSERLWKVRDATSDAKRGLKAKQAKEILAANGLPSNGGADVLVSRLADALYFGIPPRGEESGGCCGTKPLHYDEATKRYVCGAHLTWGSCPYGREIGDTACQPLSLGQATVGGEWLKSASSLCGSGFPVHRRVHVQRAASTLPSGGTKPVAAAASSSSSSNKRKQPAASAPRKLIRKPNLSRASADPDCGVDATHHVLDDGFVSGGSKPDPSEPFPVDLYDATLCRTDLGNGTNSKYRLQVLVPDKGLSGTVYLWRVWGRVGGDGGGGSKLQECTSTAEARGEFRKLFRKYTGNRWEDRKNFVKKPGANMFLQMDMSYVDVDDDDDGGGGKKRRKGIAAGDPASGLPLRVQEVVALISDDNIAEAALESLQFDATKMPLGQMTDSQLRDAYSVLTQIDALLDDGGNDEDNASGGGMASSAPSSNAKAMKDVQIQHLSNQFYTKCPSTNPVIIDTRKALQDKIRMVDELLDLQISASVMGNGDRKQRAAKKAPIDEAYEKLKADLIPLDTDGDEFKMLDRYVTNTRNATAKGVQGWCDNDWETRNLRMVDAFAVVRRGEADAFEPSKSLGNRRLLWHGSRIANYGGILGQGLRIAPAEAPASGYRFGKGVYFADLLGKSANYCRTEGSSEMLVMACDVALGVPFETARDRYMEKAQPGTSSTHALAEIIPRQQDNVLLKDEVCSDGKGGGHAVACHFYPSSSNLHSRAKKGTTDQVLVPLGRAVPNPAIEVMPHRPGCDVNEFVVYDKKQVNIRFLLRLTTNPKSPASTGFGGNGYNSQVLRPPRSYVLSEKEVKGNGNTADSDLDSDGETPGGAPVGRFINNDMEDYTAPSASRLEVLTSRTFNEGLRLTIVKGDITNAETDAVVNPCDESLGMGGQVGQKISAAAGDHLSEEVECLVRGGLRLGTSEAHVVNGHDLPANFVVFVASPIFDQQPSADVAEAKLRAAVKNVLRECSGKGMETVTMPSVGSGQAGYDKRDAAKWIVHAISEYLEEEAAMQRGQQSLREVCFCLYDDLSLKAYKDGILALEDSTGRRTMPKVGK